MDLGLREKVAMVGGASKGLGFGWECGVPRYERRRPARGHGRCRVTFVPVVERGASEAVTGFSLTFVVVTNTPKPDEGFASIIALDSLAPVGHLRRSIDGGEVVFVLVDEDHRRRGVATLLWNITV